MKLTIQICNSYPLMGCVYVYIYMYPGGLRPDRRAPGDFAEEGAFQNIFLLRCVYVF